MKVRKAIIPAAGLGTRYDVGNKLRIVKFVLNRVDIRIDRLGYLKSIVGVERVVNWNEY